VYVVLQHETSVRRQPVPNTCSDVTVLTLLLNALVQLLYWFQSAMYASLTLLFHFMCIHSTELLLWHYKC